MRAAFEEVRGGLKAQHIPESLLEPVRADRLVRVGAGVVAAEPQ